MSGFDLTLPKDVPWERVGTAVGLMDFITAAPGRGDPVYTRDTPNVWKPSLSIFAYVVPREDAAMYPDRRIVYLKIPVTLTGIRPIIHREKPGFDILSPTDGIRLEFEESTPYLPCHGALVHVAVYPVPVPKQKDWRQYPYIMDMEPKRREIYQAVTDSQQYLEGSTNQIAFGKTSASETTTQAGFRFGTSGVSGGENPVPIEGGYNTGTSATQRAGANLNVDWSREKRETLSHTSQINQIHQVQVAYHLGSNRAFLAIQPRPGLDESEFLLLNGPRKIEGIQDFILVINVPAALKGICVYAKVESAHVYRYAQDDPGTLLLVSNEAEACLSLDPKEDLPHVAITSGKEHLQLDDDRPPMLPHDVHVVYEKPIPPPPRRKPRAQPREQMHAVNRYVEENISQGMLDSVLSSTRYPTPVAFSETRAARTALARLLRDMPRSDPRNAPIGAIEGVPAATKGALKRAGIERLRDLFDPSLERPARAAGLTQEALDGARRQVSGKLL